jgi:D-lactate dehydrogenase (cytochrome)
MTRFAGTRQPRIALKRGKSTSASPRPTPSSWVPARAGLLAVVIGGVGFGAGVAFNKSSGHDINYSRASKFPAPKYGTAKDMQAVSPNQHP